VVCGSTVVVEAQSVEMRKFDQELAMQASSFFSFFLFRGLLSRIQGGTLFSVKNRKDKGGPAVQRSLKRSAIPLTSQTRGPGEEQREPVAGGFCISGERIGCRRHR
jgi:hypothetical protein